MTAIFKNLYENPENFIRLSNDELYALDYDEVSKIQLHHFQKRFEKFRSELKALQRLADDVEIESITSFDDLASLGFPHTMYKSYATADVDNGRYDRMTRWLQGFTTHNLSAVDLAGVDTLDGWLDAIETQTPLRPAASSGTSGKISLFPRSTVEVPFFLEHVLRMFGPHRDMVASGNYPFICAYPGRRGRQGTPIMLDLLHKHVYGGRDDMIITLGNGFTGANELWLAGKLRRAETLGEKLVLTPREQALGRQLAADAQDGTKRWDDFIERAVLAQKGKTVVYNGFWVQLYQIALECAKRGVKVEWAQDSVLVAGGGTKGYTFPDDWMDTVRSVFPFDYPSQYREVYAMTETNAVSLRCDEGHLHPLPWGIQHVSDPETGLALPRKGVQRGRMLVMDLLASTYWSGTATGDDVTINWDGGCGCGRKGPYILNEIKRLADTRGGDDKITCAKTPQAFDRLEEFLTA
ncbi:long-chain-fatty-acid--protein ligase [Rhizorhabdus argentea]|uniref:hypothetical protein n=1 Tax=Rhizorhabdus argentea TaxID=1387174 RepID=UPI0030ECE911